MPETPNRLNMDAGALKSLLRQAIDSHAWPWNGDVATGKVTRAAAFFNVPESTLYAYLSDKGAPVPYEVVAAIARITKYEPLCSFIKGDFGFLEEKEENRGRQG